MNRKKEQTVSRRRVKNIRANISVSLLLTTALLKLFALLMEKIMSGNEAETFTKKCILTAVLAEKQYFSLVTLCKAFYVMWVKLRVYTENNQFFKLSKRT